MLNVQTKANCEIEWLKMMRGAAENTSRDESD